MTTPEIILASASPRRSDLLSAIGLDFKVIPADLDETILINETGKDLVYRLSQLKARAVAKDKLNTLVIAADTVVVLDNKILEKPKDIAQNAKFIELLSARAHQVYTGHTISFHNKIITRTIKTDVYFRNLSQKEISWYANTKEGLDKAGGYGIQEKGAILVEKIDGCYFNVMGLSLANIVTMAQELGIDLV